ncbi:MAG: hypothetical protein KDC87_01620 [Planctomycetes bacterium]|nr:hypothetical protein [Planctomycetota bacterium]MCB9872074.1 hypothetical protein [Planctomycetota bacterium]
MKERGYTLVELMGYVALLAAFCALLASFASRMWGMARVAEGYAGDLEHVRRALMCLEQDLDRARLVQAGAGSCSLTIGTSEVRYDLVDGSLTRTSGVRREVVARRLAAFTLRPRGPLVDVEIRLRARQPGRAGRAVLHTTVFCGARGKS